MIYNNQHIEVGDKIGPRGAIFIEEKGCYDNLTFSYIQDILDKKDNRFDVKGLTNA